MSATHLLLGNVTKVFDGPVDGDQISLDIDAELTTTRSAFQQRK
jgi:hypothetical protein